MTDHGTGLRTMLDRLADQTFVDDARRQAQARQLRALSSWQTAHLEEAIKAASRFREAMERVRAALELSEESLAKLKAQAEVHASVWRMDRETALAHMARAMEAYTPPSYWLSTPEGIRPLRPREVTPDQWPQPHYVLDGAETRQTCTPPPPRQGPPTMPGVADMATTTLRPPPPYPVTPHSAE